MRTESTAIWSGIESGSRIHCTSRFEARLFVRAAGGGLGGDVHCLRSLDDTSARLAIADVMGHGPGVARTAGWVHARMLDALTVLDDGAALQELNRTICEWGRKALSTAVILGFDLRAGILTYANAGHLPVLFYRDDAMGWRVLWQVDRGRTISGMPLGAHPRTEYFTRRVVLRPRDRFVLVTDGVTDVLDPRGARFGFDRLRALLADHAGENLAELVDTVVGSLLRFGHEDLDHDDVTLLAVEVL